MTTMIMQNWLNSRRVVRTAREAATFGAALVALFLLCNAQSRAQSVQDATVSSPAPTAAGASTAGASTDYLDVPTTGKTPEQLKAAELALIKSSQNPIGNIALIPFQNNWNYGYGPYVRTQYNLTMQPVVPISLGPSSNLIERSVIPMVSQPSPLGPAACASPTGCPWTFGLSDIQEQLYFAPRTKPGDIIWGAGPIFYLPTATPGSLGSGKTSVGPTAVASAASTRCVCSRSSI